MRTKFFVLIILVFLSSFVGYAKAKGNEYELFYFWGEGCSHCEEAKEFINDLKNEYPDLTIKSYEIFENKKNRKIFKEKCVDLGVEMKGVPAFIIGNRIWFGESEQNHKQIRTFVKIINNQVFNETINNEIKLPIIGKISSEKTPILLLTVFIAFIDGFNPCSLWVLIFLLNFILYSGSRKRVLIVGLTFLIVSAFTYGLFISGIFTIFSYVKDLYYIRLIIFTFLLIFSLVNIKDYFYFNKGFSFSIPEKFKPKILINFGQLSRIEGSNLKLILATAVSSFGITLLELPCTAGFPFMWMNILGENNVSKFSFLVFLFVYLLIYFLDELVITLVAYVTLRIKRVDELMGRKLKLISGIIMFYLAGGMLVKPEVMSDIFGILYVTFLTFITYLFITSFLQTKKRSEKDA